MTYEIQIRRKVMKVLFTLILFGGMVSSSTFAMTDTTFIDNHTALVKTKDTRYLIDKVIRLNKVNHEIGRAHV